MYCLLKSLLHYEILFVLYLALQYHKNRRLEKGWADLSMRSYRTFCPDYSEMNQARSIDDSDHKSTSTWEDIALHHQKFRTLCKQIPKIFFKKFIEFRRCICHLLQKFFGKCIHHMIFIQAFLKKL